jgi:hypothetical protein
MDYKKYLNKPVVILWRDAYGCVREDLNKVNNMSPKNFLAYTETYGIFYKYDNEAVLIASELSNNDDIGFTTIPIKWIASIDELQLKGGKKWQKKRI